MVWVEVAPGRQRLVDTGAKVADDATGVYVRPEHLSPRARRALRIQLGRDFDSESSLRSYLKANDMRLIDKGEKVDKVRRSREEWIKGTKPGERGKAPHVMPSGYSHY